MVKQFTRVAVAAAAAVLFAATGLLGGVRAGAASSVSLTRAPYVTDLTSTSAYVDWGLSQPVVGSVIVLPETGGACPDTISWATSENPIATPTTDPLNGGSTGWAIPHVGNTQEYQASVPVTGLQPSTTYCYAVFPSDTAAAPQLWATQSFTTLAAPGTSTNLTFDVVGDTGQVDCSLPNGTTPATPCADGVNTGERNIFQEIGDSGAQFLLMAGDVSYDDGSESDYGDLDQTPSASFPEMSNIFGPSYFPEAKGIPTFVADGNHGQNANDLWTWPQPQTVAGDAPNPGTYAMQTPAAVDGISTSGTDPAAWYAVQDGQVRIYVLDAAWADGNVGSTTGAACANQPSGVQTSCLQYQADADEHWQTSSAEYQWLQADLAAHPGGVKMAVFHYPLRSINNSQPTDPYLGGLESLLAANGVEVVFNGHAHTYQRFVPVGGGVASYVTGGGGGVLEPVDGNGDSHGACADALASNSVYALGWSPAQGASTPTQGTGSACSTGATVAKPTSALQVFNFLEVHVSGATVTVTAVNADDQVFDSQTFTYPNVPSSPGSPGSPPGSPGSPPSSGLPFGGPAACSAHLPAGAVVGSAALPGGSGYDEVDRFGDVATFGSAPCLGSMTGTPLNQPIVGMAITPDGRGYWLVASDGGIFSFGDAGFYGSTGAIRLNQPIVGMASTASGHGYWLVAADGGIFAYGDAAFLGSTGGMRLNRPVVGMAVDRATGGYWLVASDGGIFAYGAPFFGSTGAMHLNQPVVGMMAAPDGSGYRFVAADGGVFCYDLPFYGSTGAIRLNQPMVAGLDDDATGGYWLTAADGGVFSFNAPFLGSAA